MSARRASPARRRPARVASALTSREPCEHGPPHESPFPSHLAPRQLAAPRELPHRLLVHLEQLRDLLDGEHLLRIGRGEPMTPHGEGVIGRLDGYPPELLEAR